MTEPNLNEERQKFRAIYQEMRAKRPNVPKEQLQKEAYDAYLNWQRVRDAPPAAETMQPAPAPTQERTPYSDAWWGELLTGAGSTVGEIASLPFAVAASIPTGGAAAIPVKSAGAALGAGAVDLGLQGIDYLVSGRSVDLGDTANEMAFGAGAGAAFGVGGSLLGKAASVGSKMAGSASDYLGAAAGGILGRFSGVPGGRVIGSALGQNVAAKMAKHVPEVSEEMAQSAIEKMTPEAVELLRKALDDKAGELVRAGEQGTRKLVGLAPDDIGTRSLAAPQIDEGARTVRSKVRGTYADTVLDTPADTQAATVLNRGFDGLEKTVVDPQQADTVVDLVVSKEPWARGMADLVDDPSAVKEVSKVVADKVIAPAAAKEVFEKKSAKLAELADINDIVSNETLGALITELGKAYAAAGTAQSKKQIAEELASQLSAIAEFAKRAGRVGTGVGQVVGSEAGERYTVP